MCESVPQSGGACSIKLGCVQGTTPTLQDEPSDSSHSFQIVAPHIPNSSVQAVNSMCCRARHMLSSLPVF